MLTEKIINSILDAEDSEARLEAFVEALLNEVSTDEESWRRKGRAILLALQNNDAHDLLVAVCGWSALSIAEKAMLVRDECEEFRDEDDALDGTFAAYWDDDSCSESPCLVNPKTHEVYNFDRTVLRHRGGASLKSVSLTLSPISDTYKFVCVPSEEMPEDETVFWYKPDTAEEE